VYTRLRRGKGDNARTLSDKNRDKHACCTKAGSDLQKNLWEAINDWFQVSKKSSLSEGTLMDIRETKKLQR